MEEKVTPKGWRPEFTYTGGLLEPSGKWETVPSNAPFPRTFPDVNFPGVDVMQIVKALRRYEHYIHTNSIMFDGGDKTLLTQLCNDIRCFRAIKEEMTAGVYTLPEKLQWYLDQEPPKKGGKEDTYV